MKIFLHIAAVFVFAAAAFGQSSDLTLRPGVASHAGVDGVYAQFSEAYRTLDPVLVSELYTADAAYLVPDSDLMSGRSVIHSNFKNFFDHVRKNGQTMAISFEIIQRRIENGLGYDVGIYTLRTLRDGKEINRGQGKFVVVAIREKDGRWRFQVDGYSGLKPEKRN